MGYVIYTFLTCLFLTCSIGYNCYLKQKLKQKQILDKEELTTLQQELASKQEDIAKTTETIVRKEEQIKLLDSQVLEKQSLIESLVNLMKEKINELNDVREQIATLRYEQDKVFEKRVQECDEKYQQHLDDLQDNINNVINKYLLQEQKIKDDLLTYEKRIAAQVENQKREELKKKDSDFYRLSLSNIEISDVCKLLDLAYTISHPEILRKLIYKSYFENKMNNLLGRVVGANSEVSAIYKITHIDSGKTYIGQTTNVKERWRKQLKCGLGIDTPSTNLFYQGMIKHHPWNFTWEILEFCPKEKLNESEKYYIDLYQTKSWGWNSKGGNVK